MFVSVGVLFAAIPIAGGGMTMHAIVGSALCTMLLGVCASILLRRLRLESSVSQSQAGISFLFVLAPLFFGTLWFSWQIEAADTRNTLPLLPMWSIMLAIAGTYWKDLSSSPERPSAVAHSRLT
jgi:drug/metabolite transporter (DMT)-like permease